LRHPSIGSKRKGRQKEANSETHSRRRSSNFSFGSSMQYLSSFVLQPRAGSSRVPVVIVTPSSPTRAVAELPPPSSPSTLEPTDATVEPSPPPPPPLTQSTGVFEDTGEVSLASVKQASIPPDVESDISVIEFDSWTISAPQEVAASEPSFFLSESLQKITFKPIRCTSHALSAVSDLYDVPVAETSGVGIIPSYFTSTPPKRSRSTGTKLRDIENNHHVEAIAPLELPIDDFYQNVDHPSLIPYPDVFDLDMYYDTSFPLRRKLKKVYIRNCTSDNTFSLQSDDIIIPPSPLSEKLPLDDFKEKYGMATSSVTVISSPVEYKHDFGSCRDNISRSPSNHSLLKNNSSPTKPQEQHRIPLHNSVKHRYINPLNDSTNMSFKTSGTTSSNSVYSIDKSPSTRVKNSQRNIHSLPAAAHDKRSRSNYCPQRSRTSSDSESDVGSMDALRARLREACDISTSFSTHTEEMEIWEPVSF
jgi:hypothetical protein